MSNLVTSASNVWCKLHLSRELPLRQFSEASYSQLRTFSTTGLLRKTAPSKARRYRAPYLANKAKARKKENIARQEVLQKERAEARGDPVRGVTTPFVESFDTGFLSPDTSTAQGSGNNNDEITASEKASDQQSPNDTTTTATTTPTEELLKGKQFNFLVQQEEVREAMRRAPYASYTIPGNKDIGTADDGQSSNKTKFKNNLIAVTRILSLENGNAFDLMTHNTQRCIQTFGRHNTDRYLPPKPPSLMSAFHGDQKTTTTTTTTTTKKKKIEGEVREKSNTDVDATLVGTTGASQDMTPSPSSSPLSRAGPDTGSSEVQIAILTAKIRALATALEKKGRQDKMNKRNLRLLVHRRQKLLRYLRRKERGGPRWQNVVDTLGLTEGTWSGEISL